jgi:hypothetical protein
MLICWAAVESNESVRRLQEEKNKCDAATTNIWPCSACIRLKLHCVPPTVNYNDRDFASNTQAYEPERVGYDSGGSGDDEYHQQVAMQQQMAGPHKNIPPIYTQQVPYHDPVGVYQPGSYGEPSSGHRQHGIHYNSMQTLVNVIDQNQHYTPQSVFLTPPLQRQHSSHLDSPETYEQDQYRQQNLADLLGELRMNEAGTSTYLEHF